MLPFIFSSIILVIMASRVWYISRWWGGDVPTFAGSLVLLGSFWYPVKYICILSLVLLFYSPPFLCHFPSLSQYTFLFLSSTPNNPPSTNSHQLAKLHLSPLFFFVPLPRSHPLSLSLSFTTYLPPLLHLSPYYSILYPLGTLLFDIIPLLIFLLFW